MDGRFTRRAALLGVTAAAGAIPPLRSVLAQPAAAESRVDITRARTDPIPIAVPALPGTRGAEIAQVIQNDLKNSGLFRPVQNAAFIQSAEAAAAQPNFQDWRVIGANALVTGRVADQGGQLRVEFRLWDVLPGQQIEGTAFTAPAAQWRRIAHLIADAIYSRLLGEKGYFDTRIVYVAESGPRDRRTRRLAIMDQDGENNRFLTDGSFQVLSPRFHPNARQIAFMSYYQNQPRVYLFNLDTGRQEVLGQFSGMTLSPRFSPDGRSVILSYAKGSDSNIYVVDLASRRERQLTSGNGLDVSPCYSPDGSQIVFNSDRGGDQQLYVMDAGGGGVRRISFGRGRYATPVWSPRGDLIAFTRFGGGSFAIGVMQPDGRGERILTEGWGMEGPTFAPNGRVLAYYRETPARDSRGNGYGARMAMIDIAGFNERQIVTPTDATDPNWSPLLS
ncbi:TolB protein [Roseomonas mucosa]|uniref:Tol-Pal system protein TolB n=1 Tax=Roseomonas mucosa TaxID=207340 RepID=A0A1S8D4L5_9PROT|nr:MULTISPECIES: Tol-Pal system beta propeller repeat protein TolB [Roseomonas]ATR20001.1 Tol-Pal system beta propeller repeat protein TolB [Roseomonas sp. FDAARGOS_362]MBS5901650.1 Tol-Pal system protein TolB [Acetobacteraceae bacterium]MCG7353086.1 Tol-Pal system beta propeller repeat protein TolB [Roseomonas mucosa]MCG7359458.1 Tol-Pal system beta propeller repeat protein TolB [Roseomonas mucosa]MDT8277712.1 Tol-Pal system beta propeller repeat protein TolB [Roseomonas mucosa]